MSNQDNSILENFQPFLEFAKNLEETNENVSKISDIIRSTDEELIKEYYSNYFNSSFIRAVKFRNVIKFFRILTLNKIRFDKNRDFFQSIDAFKTYVEEFKEKLKDEEFPRNFEDEINQIKGIEPFYIDNKVFNFDLNFIAEYVEVLPDSLNKQFQNYGGFNFFRHFNIYNSKQGIELRYENSNLWNNLFNFSIRLLGLNPEDYFIDASSFFRGMGHFESDFTWAALVKSEISDIEIEEDKTKSFQIFFNISPEGFEIGTYIGAKASDQLKGFIEKNVYEKRENLLNYFTQLKKKYPSNIRVRAYIENQMIENNLDESLDDVRFQEKILDLFKINLSLRYIDFLGDIEEFKEVIKDIYKIYTFLIEEKTEVLPLTHSELFLKNNLVKQNFLKYKEKIIQKLGGTFIGINLENLIEKILRILNSGRNIILYGAPGTGKTMIIEDVFKVLKNELDVINGILFTTASSDWTIFETIGGLIPYLDGLNFKPGTFLRCFKESGQFINNWLIVDELNRANIDKAFGYFFSILSDQEVELPFTTYQKKIVKVIPLNKLKNQSVLDGDIIDLVHSSSTYERYFVSPNWRMAGTINTSDKASLHQLSHAFIRRFGFVEVPIPDINDFMTNYKSNFKSSEEKQLRLKKMWIIINKYYKIGPAIIIDMDMLLESSDLNIFDAFEAYILPQIETLPNDIIDEIIESLKKQYTNEDEIDVNNFNKYKIEF